MCVTIIFFFKKSKINISNNFGPFNSKLLSNLASPKKSQQEVQLEAPKLMGQGFKDDIQWLQ